MTTYNIVWRILIDAESPQEAANTALAIQRDTASEADIFEVTLPDGTIQRIIAEETG